MTESEFPDETNKYYIIHRGDGICIARAPTKEEAEKLMQPNCILISPTKEAKL